MPQLSRVLGTEAIRAIGTVRGMLRQANVIPDEFMQNL
jgi:hypothetical protein